MSIFHILFFIFLGAIIGWGFTYMRTIYKYSNKPEIDKCYRERSEFKQEIENLKKEKKELEEKIRKLNKDLESAHREIAEKNKYLSEDKVIVERLFEIKQLSDKISGILIDYDKETIKHLLKEYSSKEKSLLEGDIDDGEKKLGW